MKNLPTKKNGGKMFDLNIPVLIVDDMMTMRKIVKKTLKEIGFTNITEAKDGADGWEKLSGANPAICLVISDWNMPNSSGLDLLKRVRGDSKTKHLPFILLTAESEKTQIVEAAKSGVSGYIIKPFTKDVLEAKLKEVYAKINAAQAA